MKKYIAILWLVIFQPGYGAEKLAFFMPASEQLRGIKKFAVADFKQNEQLNTDVSNYLINALLEHDFFNALDSTTVESILADTCYSRPDMTIADSIPQLCDLLQVDAIIQGDVTEYTLLPDSTGEEEISRNIWTGEYERDETGHIIEENIGGVITRKKKIVEKLIKLPFRIRRGIVTIVITVVDGETGLVARSEAITQEYNSGKRYGDEIKTLPSESEIMNSLVADAIDLWVAGISPNSKIVKRDIEEGSELLESGKSFAKNGRWDDAINAWQAIIAESPNTASAYYNLGVAYEAIAEYEIAETQYKKALLLVKKRRYQKALDRMQKARDKRYELLKGMQQ